MRTLRKYEDDWVIHNAFLDEWNLERLQTISLEEYVSFGDTDTFVRQVERGTRELGSILGAPSYKFGIYKRDEGKEGYEKIVFSNDTYSWLKSYGYCNGNHQEIFKKVHKKLLTLIDLTLKKDFEAIDSLTGFYNSYKWKIVFLYSKGEIVPVFSEPPLNFFVEKYGLENSKKYEYAKRYRYLYDKKPKNQSVYNFMRVLFDEYDLNKEKFKKTNGNKRSSRDGTLDLGKKGGKRKGTKPSTFESPHKDLQEQLFEYLDRKYPTKTLLIYEKNYIDILLRTEKEVHYYEVKSDKPLDCIKKGFGQVLSYAYFDESDEPQYNNHSKKAVIFGKSKADNDSLNLIKYLNTSFKKIEIHYLSLEEIKEK